MAKTSPELLSDILGVLGQINTKLDAMKSGTETKTAAGPENKASKGMGLNLNEFAQDKKKNDSIRDTADAIKILSSALGPLSSGLMKFGLVPKMFKTSIKNFLTDILQIGTPEAAIKAKTAAESMAILGDALPKLAKGVFRFGIMSQLGLVAATCAGIDMLMVTLAAAGAAGNAPLLAGAAALAAVGVALNGIANVLKSIAVVVLAFAAAIVIMVGAIFLAKKLFHVGPLAAMGIIVASIAILAGGFALIGMLSPLITGAGIAITAMGIGLGLLGIGLLAFVGSIALINKITGSQEKTDAAIKSALRSTMLISLLFAGLGLIGGLIRKGGDAVQHMGKGMMFLAGGLLLLGGTMALLNLMKVDLGEMLPSLARGLAILGLTFAGIGLFSPLILMGTAALLAISISIGLFSLISLGIGAIITKLGGEKGLSVMTDNISLLISSVLKGVIHGVSNGLLGEPGDRPESFFGKVGKIVKNVGILIGSIGLLMGVSYALVYFAFALKAFTHAGIIKTVIGYKPNGDPIFGESVNVISAGENIAKSIGSFFTTLTKTFKDPTIIPNNEDTEKIVDILMGNQGFRILGIRWAGKKRPGLIDALSKFANLISIFAKVNKIPIYDIDANGNTKIKEYTDTPTIAKNIILTLKSFFKAFKDNQSTLNDISTEATEKIAEVLFGQSAFKFLGLKVGRDKPGILEPILKFTEVLVQYAKLGANNELPIEFDEKGKVIKSIPIETIATNMVTGISSFLNAFNTAFSAPGIVDNISKQSKSMDKALGNFSSVITKFDDLAKSLTSIDKLSESIGSLATNIGNLVVNMDSLKTDNLEKLAKIAAQHAVTTQGVTINTQGATTTATSGLATGQPDWDIIADKIGSKIAEKLSSQNTGEFQFRFMDTDAGNLSIKR